MAVYYEEKIFPADVPKPPIGPLTGLAPMRRARYMSVIRAQDKIPGLGRRTHFRRGLRGADEWLAHSGDTPAAATERTVGRSRCIVTPGHFLQCVHHFIQHGTTSDSPAQARFELEVRWVDAAASAASESYGASVEKGVAGDEPTGNGDLWTALERDHLVQIRPDDVDVPGTLNRWTVAPCEAWLEWEDLGAPRIVDAVVYEVPYRAAFEADDDGSELVIHGASGLNILTPLTRLSETTPDGDPRGGSLHMLDVHHAQTQRLGPILVYWTNYTEHNTTGGDTEDDDTSTTSSTFVGLIRGSQTAYDATLPGWSVGCYAHDFLHNSDRLIMEGRNGAIPVRVRVYGNVTSGMGTFRFQTAAHSYVDVEVTATSDQWTDAYGWLEVGVSPEDQDEDGNPKVGQAFFKTSAGTFTLRDFQVEYDRTWDGP